MRMNDAISGILLLILSASILIVVADYPTIPGQDIGPAAFPRLLGILLLIASLVLIFQGVRDRARGWIRLGEWTRSPRHLINVALVVGGLVFYILFSEELGFIPCGVLILSALFLSLRVRPVLVLPIAVLATLGIHTVFYQFLRVPLPWGLLQDMAW
ncbi:tripartite tricarboxylate transporter TctB family protein [Telmatospirillum sp. J64-1]|uniref:tripartite tricarboxylate transporter TctB family protein n=1 Tax=Telmatospirillum sp. J64-1 TaxID=2502183 RepID=UPI00115CF9BA|nr:tripartite tricarboxylate transporter TctB family protein [Telmatospirillum sp. J64-1]